MPRSGDIYGPPAGSKGTPGTTIQSSKYNALVDDLTADANAPRPVTAGGTGSTNATQARVNLQTDNADNLTKGTVPDARLASTIIRRKTYGANTSANDLPEGLSITDGAALTNFPYAGAVNNWRVLTIGTAGRGLQIANNYNDANNLYFRMGQDGWLGWSRLWCENNDGPGSGLAADTADNADRLDGQHGSWFADIPARLGYTPISSAGGTFTGSIGVGGAVPSGSFNNGKAVAFGDSDTGVRQNGDGVLEFWTNGVLRFTLNAAGQAAFSSPMLSDGVRVVREDAGTYGINISGTAANANNANNANTANTAGSAGNAGNADNLGGVPASQFVRNNGDTYAINISGTAQNANNANNANTANTAGSATNAANANNAGNADNLGGVPASQFVRNNGDTYSINISGTSANVNRQIVAGSGLTGGGVLNADRSIALGTPSSITNATSNSASSTTHTHALGFVAAEVYTGSDPNNLVFPLGESLLVRLTAGVDRNAAVSGVYLTAGSTQSYSNTPNGTALSGVWRARGMDTNSGSGNAKMKRTA